MAACFKDGYRYVIIQERKRVAGLPAYESYEEAEQALLKYDPYARHERRRDGYAIWREFAR